MSRDAEKEKFVRQTQNFEVLFLRRVPVDVKTQFKAACSTMRDTMTRALIRMMRLYIEEVNEGPPPPSKRKWTNKKRRFERAT